MVLCIQNSNFSTSISSLYGSQTSPVVLYMQHSVISTRNTSLHGSQPSSVVFACKTTTLGPELQVSMGPRPHLCFFFHSKQRLQHQNCMSLWVPTLICGFCIQNNNFSTRIASLYGSQPSSVVLCIQNSDFSIRNTSLYLVQALLCGFVHSQQRHYDQN